MAEKSAEKLWKVSWIACITGDISDDIYGEFYFTVKLQYITVLLEQVFGF